MKKMFKILIGTVFVANYLFAQDMPKFTLHKLESDVNGTTLLVIGGIQGDEPGGFTAASMLVTNYKIKKGNVWVVPNLNFESIIKRSRGVYGDMNRKFSHITKKDPDFDVVENIKSIILDKKIDVIVHLHDGSGFYRDRYVNEMKNPDRWGQSAIIDQNYLNNVKFGNLEEISNRVVKKINSNLLDDEHIYRVRNTKTALGNEEMEKTLTWFAIKNNKPAYANEASKEFLTNIRTYYHLLAVEGYMKEFGIEFERNIDLEPSAINKEIDENVKISMFDNKIFLDVSDAKDWLNYIPMKKNSSLDLKVSNPLIAIIKSGDLYRIYNGNRRLSYLDPEYFDYDYSINSIDIFLDGNKIEANFGTLLEVENSFLVKDLKDYRVNVIGFTNKSGVETNVEIKKADILDKFSVDNKGNIYRVEVYKKDTNSFTGMILVKFIKKKVQINDKVVYRNNTGYKKDFIFN